MNYHVLNDSLILNYDGATTPLASTDPRYALVLECIRSGRLNDIRAIMDPNAGWNIPGVTVVDGVVHVDGTAIPSELSDRLKQFKLERLPFEPLIAFWRNLKSNPSFNSRQMLYKFLEHNGHPITTDGCFIAYRGVREDLKDVHTGKWDNSPGKVCKVDRSEVDDNPNNTCSFGLHVACFDYAHKFGHTTIEVKVNPRDVVAVPTDYNGTKMRVSEFEVLALVTNPRTEALVHRDEWEPDECDECGSYECNGECEA